MAKHKNYEVIMAYSNGENIQNRNSYDSKWIDYKLDYFPDFNSDFYDWRVRPNYDEIVDRVLRSLDFDTINTVVRALDIKWYNEDWGTFTPSVIDLLNEARNLCIKQLESQSDGISYGRLFSASVQNDILSITFVTPFKYNSSIKIKQ
jgi:hypothetical protein